MFREISFYCNIHDALACIKCDGGEVLFNVSAEEAGLLVMTSC